MARHYIRWFEEIGIGDVASVGGKNASLGEMVRNLGCYDIKVPTGFATTADGYRHFLVANNLGPVIASSLAELKGGRLVGADREAVEPLSESRRRPPRSVTIAVARLITIRMASR